MNKQAMRTDKSYQSPEIKSMMDENLIGSGETPKLHIASAPGYSRLPGNSWDDWRAKFRK